MQTKREKYLRKALAENQLQIALACDRRLSCTSRLLVTRQMEIVGELMKIEFKKMGGMPKQEKREDQKKPKSFWNLIFPFLP